MPSAFGLGLTNAEGLFDGFASGDIVIGTQAMTTADVALGVAHGLSGTPDFVLFTTGQAAAAAAEGLAWTANATTLTWLKVDTQAATTFSYLYGNLS